MEPINYSIDVKSPFESAVQGYQLGNVMQQDRLKMDQANLQQQQQIQMQKDLAALANNPNATAQDFSSMMVRYPSLSEHFKRSWEILGGEQQKSRLTDVTQVYAALQTGNTDVATALLDRQIEANRNSGRAAEVKNAETLKKMIELNPETAKTSTALALSSILGPEKFAETFGKLGQEQRAAEKAPSELSSAQSKAQKDAVEAKFAESNAAIDLQKKGWDITKIIEDVKIAKENSRIAALNAATAREGNQLRREEMGLKLQELTQKRDDAVRTKAADVEAARSTMDNMLNTADRILATPVGVIESATGPISSRIPTLSSDTADFEELVETLGSQAFLAQVPNMKGMGALSNAEGEKLQSALQSLKLRQSRPRLVENVKEAQRLILKGRANLTTRYGVPENVPDTPAAAPTAQDVDALLKKYGPR